MKQPKRRRINVAAKDREYLTSNLAILIEAAVPVGEAIESMAESGTSRALKKALKNLALDISEGYSLSQALKRNRLVNEQTLSLIEIGEQTGNLVNNLAMATKQEQKQRYFRAKLLSAMMYPAFVLGLTFLVALGIGWLLLPRLAQTFVSLDVELPLISKILLGIGTFLQANGLWAVPTLVGSVVAVSYLLFGFPPTRHIGLRLISHMPGIGKLVKELEIARFGYLLSSLIDAGLPITRALQLLSRAATLPSYKKFYTYLGENFEQGINFQDSFKKYKRSKKLLPVAVQQIIIGGERSGSLTTTLHSVSEIYDEKVEITTANFEAVIEPILLVIVWIGVMFVALAVIVPVYSLVGGLGG